jgi:hypothetical protein
MTPLVWWILGVRAGVAEVAPGSSRGGMDDVVVDGGGLLEGGERGWEVAPPLVPTSSAATADASGKSTDWIRSTNMMMDRFAGLLGPFPSFWAPGWTISITSGKEKLEISFIGG